MGLELVGVVLGGLSGLGMLGLTYIIFKTGLAKDQNASDKSDATRLAVLETKVDLLWTDLQKDLARGIRNA